MTTIKDRGIKLPTVTNTSEFNNFVKLISVFTDATNQLAEMETSTNQAQLDLVDEQIDPYTKLQELIAKTEQALELIARKHPEWFGGKASVKTPYGTVKLTDSTALVVDNEDLTMAMIEREQDAVPAPGQPQFCSQDYIRIKKTLNIEALETLDDSTLLRFKIKREKRSNFSVTPAKLDMGKAVKAAQEKQQAA